MHCGGIHNAIRRSIRANKTRYRRERSKEGAIGGKLTIGGRRVTPLAMKSEHLGTPLAPLRAPRMGV